MKTNLFLTLFLVFHCFIHAQDIQTSMTWGELNVEASTMIKPILLDDHIYTLKVNQNGFALAKKSNILIQKFDLEMNEVAAVPSQLEYNDSKAVPYQLLPHDDGLALVFITREDDKKQLRVTRIDLETLEPIGEVQFLAEGSKRSTLRLVSGEQSEYFGVLTLEVGKLKGAKINKFRCFNSNLELFYETMVSIDLVRKQMLLEKALLDENGALYAILYIPNNKKRKQEYTPVLWRYNLDLGKSNTIILEAPRAKAIRSLTLGLDDGLLIIGGYYSLNNPYDNASRGFLVMQMDRQSEVSEEFKAFPFDYEILKHAEGFSGGPLFPIKRVIKGYVGLRAASLQSWDGHGYILAGEQWYIVSQTHLTTVGDGRTERTGSNSELVIGNTVVTLLSEDLEPQWSETIVKKSSDNYLNKSYSHFLGLEQDAVIVLSEGGQRSCLLRRIEADGNGLQYNIFDRRTDKVRVQPRSCFQLENGRYFIYARNMTKDRLGVLSIE